MHPGGLLAQRAIMGLRILPARRANQVGAAQRDADDDGHALDASVAGRRLLGCGGAGGLDHESPLAPPCPTRCR
jgi:hypothetical protein